MIRPSGGRGPEFDSRLSPFVWVCLVVFGFVFGFVFVCVWLCLVFFSFPPFPSPLFVRLFFSFFSLLPLLFPSFPSFPSLPSSSLPPSPLPSPPPSSSSLLLCSSLSFCPPFPSFPSVPPPSSPPSLPSLLFLLFLLFRFFPPPFVFGFDVCYTAYPDIYLSPISYRLLSPISYLLLSPISSYLPSRPMSYLLLSDLLLARSSSDLLKSKHAKPSTRARTLQLATLFS